MGKRREGIDKAKPSDGRRIVHFLARLGIRAVGVRLGEIGEDKLGRFQAHAVREIIVPA